jgi:hypothetical protein
MPVASMTAAAEVAGPDRSGSIALMRPASTATSATREPSAVTTVPPRMTSAVTGNRAAGVPGSSS